MLKFDSICLKANISGDNGDIYRFISEFFESSSLLIEFSTRSLLFNAMGIAYIIM